MINNVILIGRLTKDIDIRTTQAGKSVASFILAVNRNKQVEGQPDADFINCVAWNRTAELMAQYLHKGSLVGIEGRIQTRSYENQRGQKVYIAEVLVSTVQFLEPKNPKQQPTQTQYQSQTQPQQSSPSSDLGNINPNYDDLPF